MKGFRFLLFKFNIDKLKHAFLFDVWTYLYDWKNSYGKSETLFSTIWSNLEKKIKQAPLCNYSKHEFMNYSVLWGG